MTEIFETGVIKPQRNMVFGHMEVRVDTEATEAEEQITYLYKSVIRRCHIRETADWGQSFRNGRSTSSFGTWFVAVSSCYSSIH